MSVDTREILHKGLQRFWRSGCSDSSGISPAWSLALKSILTHLSTAASRDDVLQGLGRQKNAERLTGHTSRYSMEVNANWRLTFDCDDLGRVTKIDLEDLHRPGGAKRR